MVLHMNDIPPTTILDVMTRGIAERPAQNGLSRTMTLEEKAPRVQTKHRLDAEAAMRALTRAGYMVVKDGTECDITASIICNAQTMTPMALADWIKAELQRSAENARQS